MLPAPRASRLISAVLHARRVRQGLARDRERQGALRRGVWRAGRRMRRRLARGRAHPAGLGPRVAEMARDHSLRYLRRLRCGKVDWRLAGLREEVQ